MPGEGAGEEAMGVEETPAMFANSLVLRAAVRSSSRLSRADLQWAILQTSSFFRRSTAGLRESKPSAVSDPAL